MKLQERLEQGQVIIMDGGTDTEMEKRGVPMHEHIRVLKEVLG